MCDVRVGSEPHLIGAGGAGGPTSLDLDDSIIGSPPPEGVRLTPPSSPHVGGTTDGTILQSAGAKERLVNILSLALCVIFTILVSFSWDNMHCLPQRLKSTDFCEGVGFAVTLAN